MKNLTSILNKPKNTGEQYFPPLFLSILVLLLLIFPGNQAHAAKSYKMQNVSIEGDLQADGAMAVSEERSYYFKDRFKYAYRTFPVDSRIGWEDFTVSENNQPYLLSDNHEPGTYTVSTKDDEIEVRWYFRAKRETRTFKLEYLVTDVVDRHVDGAVLYHQFIGDNFRKPTMNVDIKINPPQPVDQWKVRQWAHGPLWGNSETSDEGVVSATCENLPKRQFFELRILYPVELFSDAPLKSGYIVDEITSEEEAWAEEANLRRENRQNDSAALARRQDIGIWALPLLVLLTAAWFFRIAIQYGTRPSVPPVASSSAEIPSDLAPAMVGYLIQERAVGASSMMATLMDLARRGFLEFKEENELGTNIFGREKWKTSHFWVLKRAYYQEHRQELTEFENMLISFVFEDLADTVNSGSTSVAVSLETFTKEKSKVQKFFSSWSKQVKEEAAGFDFFDQDSFRGRNKAMMLGGALFVLALPMIPVVKILALIPAIAGLIMIIGSNGIVHHTREGLILEKKWKSLKKYLKKQGFKSAEPASVLEFIEPYFVYGVVLGMDKGQLEGLGSMIPTGRGGYYMPWYHGHNSEGGMVGDSFGSSFSTAVASVNSAMSSSTGAGGGASGGGGGGSGGGGGGAG